MCNDFAQAVVRPLCQNVLLTWNALQFDQLSALPRSRRRPRRRRRHYQFPPCRHWLLTAPFLALHTWQESPPDDPVRMLDLGDGEDEAHPAELPAALPAAVGAVGATAPEPAAIEGMADDQLGGGSPAQQQQKQRQQQRQQGAEAESGEERHRLPLQRGQFGPASPPPLSPFNRQQQSREQQEQAEDEDGEERHPLSPLNRQQQRQERRERACVAPAVDSPPAAAAGGRRQRRVTFAAPPAQQPGQLNSEDSDAAAEPGTSTGTGGALRPADPMQQLVHGMGSLSMRAADRQETRLRHAQLENCALRRQLHLAEEELRRQAWRAGAAAARRQRAVIAESEEDDSGDREPAGFPSRRSLRGGAAPTSSRSSDSRRLLGGSRRRGGYQWEHAECSLEDSSSGEEDEQELWPRSRRGGVQSRGMQDQLRRSSRRAAGSSDWAGASALEAAPSRRSGGRSLRAHTHQQPEGSSGDDAASWAGGQSTASRGQPTASLPSCSTGRRSRQPPAGCTSRGGAAAAGASKGAQQVRTIDTTDWEVQPPRPAPAAGQDFDAFVAQRCTVLSADSGATSCIEVPDGQLVHMPWYMVLAIAREHSSAAACYSSPHAAVVGLVGRTHMMTGARDCCTMPAELLDMMIGLPSKLLATLLPVTTPKFCRSGRMLWGPNPPLGRRWARWSSLR